MHACSHASPTWFHAEHHLALQLGGRGWVIRAKEVNEGFNEVFHEGFKGWLNVGFNVGVTVGFKALLLQRFCILLWGSSASCG